MSEIPGLNECEATTSKEKHPLIELFGDISPDVKQCFHGAYEIVQGETKNGIKGIMGSIDTIPEDKDFCRIVSENLTVKLYNKLAEQVNNFFDTSKAG